MARCRFQVRFALKDGRFPLKYGRFSLKDGRFPLKYGRFPLKYGRLYAENDGFHAQMIDFLVISAILTLPYIAWFSFVRVQQVRFSIDSRPFFGRFSAVFRPFLC